MARDVVALLSHMGIDRFALAGHDRGAYVAFRGAMDYPDRVTALAVMDAIPIADALDRCDATFASTWWHWFFLGQTSKPAERVITLDPDAWYKPDPASMDERNYRDYLAAIHDPETVHAMCEDYRAGLGIDAEHDRADRRDGRRVRCPLLAVWSAQDDLEDLYTDPLTIWRNWADDVRGAVIDSGHHMAEERPDELAVLLADFLAGTDHVTPLNVRP
jgi:haloacetate dehalogenase